MSDNKHKVATDALETLGTIIDETAGRDAIHLAVEPCIAGEKLWPGQHVRYEDGKGYSDGQTFGIVDPFLKGPVYEGQHFWFVVYPRQISSLRHVWEHPLFPKADAKNAAPEPVVASTRPPTVEELSMKWIADYAASIPLDYAVLMDGARRYIQYGDYLSYGSLLEGEYLPDEFWTHYEIITGESVDEDSRNNFFSCSC